MDQEKLKYCIDQSQQALLLMKSIEKRLIGVSADLAGAEKELSQGRLLSYIAAAACVVSFILMLVKALIF